MSAPLRIAVAGLGTVGAGLLRLLTAAPDLLASRAGRPLEVTAVAARDRTRDRGVDLSGLHWFDDPVAMAADPGTDLVVELIGGSDGVARQVCETALEYGKPVVTANKALLAEHGRDLVTRAEQVGVALAFEASVAGGVPIVKGLREGLAGNRVSQVSGILNGTCNYILSEMRQTGADFDETLAEAVRLGYAEADPSFDIDGIDAAHKVAILAGLAFGGLPSFQSIHVEGIRHVTARDIAFANELGYRIKLIGLARRRPDGLDLRVHPALIPEASPLAGVDGVFNAVEAHGEFADRIMMQGRGAGAGPTASAVAADIIDIARGFAPAPLGAPSRLWRDQTLLPIGTRTGAYYLRLTVLDQPGVLADIAAAMRDHAVSVASLLQYGRAPGDRVPLVVTTHDVLEADFVACIAALQQIAAVVEPPRFIRIEML